MTRRRQAWTPQQHFAPIWQCPARGQIGQGNIGIHSCKDKRFLCTACHKTFSATKGTAFYRLRTSAETVSVVVTLLAHGCPLQAVVVAFALAYARGTVAGWVARAGTHGLAVQEHLVEQPRDLGQVQADEIRVKIALGGTVAGLVHWPREKEDVTLFIQLPRQARSHLTDLQALTMESAGEPARPAPAGEL